MKRLIVWLMLAVLLVTSAAAESLNVNKYTNVPTAMTQDSVAEILVQPEGYQVEALQPDEQAIALLNQVYAFVLEEKQSPARFYDEETQKKIADLAKIGIDALHMTEAMSLQLSTVPVEVVSGQEAAAVEAIEVAMRLNVEYDEGQLVIVVLGVAQEDGSYVWYPCRGRVETLGEIKWDIPVADWETLSLQPISFHVLTNRVGPRGEQLWVQPAPSASKTAQDVIGMRYWYTVEGEAIADTFRVWLTDLTEDMQAEVARIGEHVAAEKPLLDYFPQERKNEAVMMLPEGVDPAKLVAYDVIALMDEEYKDTYGDVSVELVFGTVYQPEKAMVVLAGFPIKDALMEPYVEWYVLRASAMQEKDSVEVALKQLVLPRMDEEPMMLVVISEELEATQE